jgi:RNA polymerase sigma factor (TIGR02999 family)
LSDVTQILQAAADGDPRAAGELLPLVYAELRQLAAAKLAREQPGHTLQATALVHEAWLRIAGPGDQRWENRRHFFGAAAEAMRRILIERARRRLRLRHGGGQERVDADAIEIPMPLPDEQVLRVSDALDELAKEDPLQAEVVKLKFFVGLQVEEIAAALGVSGKTVQRQWNHAKAWLYQHMQRVE